MALTKRQIEALRYDPDGPRQQIQWGGIDDLPGFGCRVYPTGRKSFVLSYRAGRRTRLLVLGAYGALTVQQARERAQKALVRVRDGADPADERQAERQAQTVAEFAEVYLERHARVHKKTWSEDERRLNKYVIPAWGQRRLADVTRADVARLHSKLGERVPYEANRVLALVAVLFSKAEEWGFLPEGSFNPAARVQAFREKSRDRWVTPAEMPALIAAIDAEPNLYIRTAFKLYLLTGLRRSELLGLRWKDVDFDRRELRLEDTKAGRSHVVPLSAPALEILRELPRQVGNAFVFPGGPRRAKDRRKDEPAPTGPLVNIAKPWRRIQARVWLAANPDAAAELRRKVEAEVQRRSKHAEKGRDAVESRLLALAAKEAVGPDAVRPHDLRRTVGSWLATGGASLPLIGKVLNHSNASTTQIYARIAEDATRVALEQHGERIGALLSGSANSGRTRVPTPLSANQP
jgi:integrase